MLASEITRSALWRPSWVPYLPPKPLAAGVSAFPFCLPGSGPAIPANRGPTTLGSFAPIAVVPGRLAVARM